MESATFTEFLRDPNRVIKRLRGSRGIVLERRGAASLVLSLKAREEESQVGEEMVAHLLAKLLDSAESKIATVLEKALVEKLPWSRLLPAEGRRAFLREYLQTAEACASAGSTAPLAELVSAWKATGEIYADPALAAELKRPLRAGAGWRISRPVLRKRR